MIVATPACQARPKNDAAVEGPAPSPVAAAAEESPAPSQPEAPAITPFGVPECDTYVKQYLGCVETRVSGEARERLLRSFEANRTKWRALATMQQGALALAIACKAATQKAKEELSVDYGCEF